MPCRPPGGGPKFMPRRPPGGGPPEKRPIGLPLGGGPPGLILAGIPAGLFKPTGIKGLP